MVIDFTYFQGGKLYIPGNTSNSSVTGNVPSRSSEIDSYIEEYEKELLLNAIGLTNYEALEAALKADSKLELPENEKWRDLVNGKAYSYENREVKWYGLREKGVLNTSLIADYVFFHYLTDDVQNYTTTGIQKEKAKNAEGLAPNLKLTQVWREFIKKYQFGSDVDPVISYNVSGRSYLDYFTTQFNVNRSLYQFLKDNDNYGDYNFRIFDNRNRFGI